MVNWSKHFEKYSLDNEVFKPITLVSRFLYLLYEYIYIYIYKHVKCTRLNKSRNFILEKSRYIFMIIYKIIRLKNI